jgi:hypothetical protein
MSRDLTKFFLLIRGQIRFDVLRIAAEQVNTSGDGDVQIDNPCAATLSLSLRFPAQFPYYTGNPEWSIK